MAEYLTTAKRQQLGVKKDIFIERDSSFRSNAERKLERNVADDAAEDAALAVEQEPILPIELETLSVRLPSRH